MPINFDIEKYAKNISTYIETGFFKGASTKKALETGFEKIHSCDINETFLEDGKILFQKEIEEGKIFLHFGRSTEILQNILNNLDEKAVFFLDAHDLNYENTKKDMWNELDGCPIMSELELIKKHKINNHTIIVDDLRMFSAQCVPGTWAYGKNVSFDNIIDKLREINENYIIQLETGIQNKDVIVAYIKE